MVGWHHRLNGYEFKQTPGDRERQGSLACCSPWGHKDVGYNLVTEQQQNELLTQKLKNLFKNDKLGNWIYPYFKFSYTYVL